MEFFAPAALASIMLKFSEISEGTFLTFTDAQQQHGVFSVCLPLPSSSSSGSAGQRGEPGERQAVLRKLDLPSEHAFVSGGPGRLPAATPFPARRRLLPLRLC